MNDCDVLIVGAGPVGLTAATTLLFHGIRPRLIERLPEVINQSRAAAIQSRTLEIFQRLGLVDKFLAQGTRVHGARIYDGKKNLIAHLQLDGGETPFSFMLGLGQSFTENLLTEGLAKYGATVERNVELVSFTQNADAVEARLRHSDGTEEVVRCKYLIGTDGSRSTVRHQLGLELVGETIPSHWLTADCSVDWEFARDEAVAFLTTNGFTFAMPIEDDRWRFISPSSHPLPEGKCATLEDVQAVCDRIVPVPCKLHTPHWVTQFGLNTRLVPSMQEGRVFLCGDAAHVHSPVGGQGMNTGIQDAYNLCWKLALRLTGRAGDSLVMSFNTERHDNAARMLRGVRPGTKIVNLHNPVAIEIRNQIMHFAFQFDAVRERIRRGVEEIDVNYCQGPLTGEWMETMAPPSENILESMSQGSDFRAGPRAGDRAPDIEGLQFADGSQGSLFESWVGDPKSQTLIFAAHSTSDRIKALEGIAATLSSSYAAWMNVRILTMEPSSFGDVIDPEGAAHRQYGAKIESLYWVRSDGYIGFRSRPVNADALIAYLKKIIA